MRKPRSALTEKNRMRIDVAPPADGDLPTEVAWLVAQGEPRPQQAHRTRAFFDEAPNPLYARILDESTRLIASG
jgi:hypothetical protein